jgi:DMSO reductase anchor subunit
MKVSIHKDSIKQKEIVKASIFFAVGIIYILWNLGQALLNLS